MELTLINLTPDVTFNYFFSIFINFAFVIVPMFGAIALIKN